jgi:Calcineurin-like phosphoesterase
VISWWRWEIVFFERNTDFNILTALLLLKLSGRSMIPVKASRSNRTESYRILRLIVMSLVIILADTGITWGTEIPPAGFKVAFLGDQGLGVSSESVLKLVLAERAQLLVHLGDFDYLNNPTAWEAQTDRILGSEFPQISVVGNHDLARWAGSQSYSYFVQERLKRMGVSGIDIVSGQYAFRYRGIFFIFTSPGLLGGGAPEFIRSQLERDSSYWRISAWHVNQTRMQVGLKGNEAGWAVYEESRLGGAIIATAHEHSYSRTHLLSNMTNQTIVAKTDSLRLRKGHTFAFVSGLGGGEIRPQYLSGDWWAAIYTATQGASHGALFGTFNVDGNAKKARFYFKNVKGLVIDSFTVISDLGRPISQGISLPPTQPNYLELDPVELGLSPGCRIEILDMSGKKIVSTRNRGVPISLALNRVGLVFLQAKKENQRLLRKFILLP